MKRRYLHERICDVEEGAINPQTYYEFIRQTEKWFWMKRRDVESYSDEELHDYLFLLDDLWIELRTILSEGLW